jgi:hypothetical protein
MTIKKITLHFKISPSLPLCLKLQTKDKLIRNTHYSITSYHNYDFTHYYKLGSCHLLLQ